MRNLIEQEGFIDYLNTTIKFKKKLAMSTTIQISYLLDLIEMLYGTKTTHSVFYTINAQGKIYYYSINYEE